MTGDCMECLCDDNPICMEQARLILDLFKKVENAKTISDIHERVFKRYFNHVKNEDWIFLEHGHYKVINFNTDEYLKVKDKDIKLLVMRGLEE